MQYELKAAAAISVPKENEDGTFSMQVNVKAGIVGCDKEVFTHTTTEKYTFDGALSANDIKIGIQNFAVAKVAELYPND